VTGTVPDPAQPREFDQPLSFTLAVGAARGRVVRLGPVLDTILSAHDYPAPVKHLLAEALVITALLGTLLKNGRGQLTIQAQTSEGPIGLLVCDFRDGELRGYVRHDGARLTRLGANPSLQALFGEGYLAVIFDLSSVGERYQGIVPLEGSSLAQAFEHYFLQSEQVPTLIRVAVRSSRSGCVAGGLLIQHLPEGEEGRERLHVRLDHPDWAHIATIASTVRHDELLDPSLDMEGIVWRLFHEEPELRVVPGPRLVRGCRCTHAHFEDVLSRFPAEDRAEMRNPEGAITVDCEFCSRSFVLFAESRDLP
jgi:molecular chaperone Hsp33